MNVHIIIIFFIPSKHHVSTCSSSCGDSIIINKNDISIDNVYLCIVKHRSTETVTRQPSTMNVPL